jgi:GrpB-like predicted nucleotidyltransferase (UPF0157 family)
MILLEPYNQRWAAQFAQVREILQRQVDGLVADIQHVGSTSVPGQWAKPVLDIDIIIGNPSRLAEISLRLEALGYQARGDQGVAGRFAFRPVAGTAQALPPHHLYVCHADSLALRNHLLFRDALRQSPELVKRYTELKKAIAANPATGREAYTQQKTAFVLEVLAAAGLDEGAIQEIRLANS